METLARAANRGSISTGYDIDNSLKMEADNSESMTRTPSSSGNRKTWTLSFWFKRTELGAAVRLFEAWDGSTGTSALFTDADLFILDLTAGGNYFTSSAVFRDTSAWYHFVIRVDTTQGTASERARVYVNGSELAGSWNSNIGQNTDLTWNQNVVHYLGVFHNSGNFANGYYAEVINVDGTSLAPTAFGEFDSDSGIWKPKNASVTYGTNGFKLEFKSSGSLGADTSGNGHTWTLNNITSADQATDTPTNNFATGNPLVPLKANTILTNGATNYKNVGSAGWSGFASSIAVQSGKWYVEFTAAGATTMCGVGNINDFLNSIYYGNWNTSIGFYGTAGLLFIDGATSGAGPNNTWTGTAYGNGDIVGIALDKDNGCVYMSVNGTFANSGDPTSGASKTGGVELTKGNSDYSASDYFYIGASHNIDNGVLQANYGGYTTDTPSSAATDANGYGTFEYAPPSGYYALCTKNLAEYG
mgnify:CR=1 FL=1